MKHLVYCACGHTLERHDGRGCDGGTRPCDCRRDQYGALESALAQARINPWSPATAIEANRALGEPSDG